MAEQQQKPKKKAEKGNPLSRQPSLIRKCTDLTDMYCNNADRSMYCVSLFSRGLLKSNEECLEHFADTVTSNLEFIPAAFKILTTIKCTGANKIRFNFILSEITRKIMDTLNLNVQAMHPQIGNKLRAREIKNEDCMEVIEILDDVDVKDITIDSLKEINEWQDTAGAQVTLARFRSNIVADKIFDSVIMKDLPSIDSGCDTVNTLDSNQVEGVASIDRESLQINQAVGGKSIHKNSFIDTRDNADTLILSGIPSFQIKSETVNLSETPDTEEVKSNGARLNIFTPLEARQFPEDPTSEDVISNSEESFSIFDLRKKSKGFRKMPHLEPIIEINLDKPPDSDLKLAPKGNPGSNEIKLNSAQKECLSSDKIKIHSISELNVDQTLKRKIQYSYKAKKKPNIDVNRSPHINIKVNSDENKDMIDAGSTKKASPKSVTFDSRKKSKSLRKMPHLEPIIVISPDKATNTDLKLATKGNPDSDEIKLNLAAKESLGSGKIKVHSVSKNVNQILKRKIHYPYKAKKKPSPTKKASPKSVINKNQQPSSKGQQPDYRVKLKPLPGETIDPESHKRAKMQSTSKASKTSADLELTKMKSVTKTAIRSVINKKLKQSIEEDPQLDYSKPLSERDNLESDKGEKAANLDSTKKSASKTAMKLAVNKKLKPSTEEDPHPDNRANLKSLSERNKESNKAAKMHSTSEATEKSPNLESTKKKSVSKAAVNLIINKNLKPPTEESRRSDDRANSKPLPKRSNLESNKEAKMLLTTRAADKSVNLESTKKKSVSKAAINLVGDENLKSSSEESRQSDNRANLKSHSEGNDIESIQNTDMQSFYKAVMKSLENNNLDSTKIPERKIQPHFNVYIVPFDRHGSTTAKSSSYAEEVWGSHNEEDQSQRPETTSKTNLGTYTRESQGQNAGIIREPKTKACENSEFLMKEAHEDLSKETNSLTTLMKRASSNDFDYDRNLLILQRVSPYQETIQKPRVRRRGGGRGRGKSVTSRSDVKGEENAVTERCRGGSIKKPLGRQKCGGRGEVRGKLKA